MLLSSSLQDPEQHDFCRGSFHSSKCSQSKVQHNPAAFASAPELQALVAVFGICGARQLASRSERPLEGALAALGDAISAHGPVLKHLDDKFQVLLCMWWFIRIEGCINVHAAAAVVSQSDCNA